MLLRALVRRPRLTAQPAFRMSATLSNGARNSAEGVNSAAVSLDNLPKSSVFTSELPPDPQFETPIASHQVPRGKLGPRMVKGALYTYVRPEGTQDPEVLAVSHAAMKDIGLREGEEKTEEFKSLVSGNKIFWDERTQEGIYPWAQCYGGSRPYAKH